MRKSNSKDSVFLFAYGVILNNNETMGALCEKFKHKMKNCTKANAMNGPLNPNDW